MANAEAPAAEVVQNWRCQKCALHAVEFLVIGPMAGVWSIIKHEERS